MTDKNEDTPSIIRIAGLVADADDHEIPGILLQLQEIIGYPSITVNRETENKCHFVDKLYFTVDELSHNCASSGLIDECPPESRELRVLRKTIWKYDLLSWCAVCLSYDFNKVKGGLETATTIASVLCDCCCFLDIDDSQEFSQTTLPAAVQSCLKVLRQFQQRKVDHIKPPSSQLRSDSGMSESIFALLMRLVSTHPHLCPTLLNSNDLLRLLMEDEEGKDFVLQSMTLMRRAIRVNRHCVSQISKNNMHPLLDELVYKLTASTDDDIAHASTGLIVAMAEAHEPMLPILTMRFKGLKAILTRWNDHGFNRDLNTLIGMLQDGSVKRAFMTKQKRAAETIWAYYVGWKTRTRMKKLKQALPTLQRSFRRKRSERQEEEETMRITGMQVSEKKLQQKRSFRASSQKHLQAIEILPADQVSQHIRNQERQAATCIQAHWRAHAQRKVFIDTKKSHKQTKAAVVIQRAARKSVLRQAPPNEQPPTPKPATFGAVLDEDRRQELQTRIEHWQAIHKKVGVSREISQKNHARAQELFLQHRRHQLEVKGQHGLDALLAKIHTDQETLTNLPALDQASCDVIEALACRSQIVRNAAQLEHDKRLRLSEQPWWKHLDRDDERDDVIMDGW